jgi:thiazole/oxazole-forming peptide maturase SagD family component
VLNKPLLVVPAISKDDRIKFILPDQEVSLDAVTTSKAWAILELCNGINTVSMITEALPAIDNGFIVGFLDDLNSLRIVIDSRKVYKHFHAVSSNPMAYPSDITDEEIAEHVRSPRLAVREGKSFDISPMQGSQLVELQSRRSSCRSFSAELLRLAEVGGLLDAGYSYGRHAVASAGGLYPMKIFAIALEDQVDFPAGYYEYDNESDRLVLFNESPDPERIAYAFNEVGMPFGAQVVLVVAADANRQPRKYSNRGYRFMAIEAGEILQNLSLGAVELGLATCNLGSLLDDVISDELELVDCLPFVAVAVGKPGSEGRVSTQQLLATFYEEMEGEGKAVQGSWLVDDSLSSNFDKSYFQFLARTRDGQVTSGISTSWADARLKAIAEGYERDRAGSVRFDVRARASDLPGPWLDPRVVAPLTDEQYDSLPYLQRFDENSEIEWVLGKDDGGREVYVPIDLVFYPLHAFERKLVVDTCSSGFAAFTDFDEAVNRGTLELVERDALMRSWYEKKSPRKLGYETLPVHLQRRVRYWERLGREVFVLDLSQKGVTIIEVVITSDDYPCFVSGASSTLGNFADAAIKAFHEAESRLIYGLNEPSVRTLEPNEVHHVLDHELLYAQSKRFHGHVQFLFDGETSSVPPVATTTPSGLKAGLDIVTVDVSENGSSLKVVKVLSPKLVPISFGHGTGHYSHDSLAGVEDDRKVIPHYFA